MPFKITRFIYIENKLKPQFNHIQRKANCSNTRNMLLTLNTCRNRKESHTSQNHVVHHKSHTTEALPVYMQYVVWQRLSAMTIHSRNNPVSWSTARQLTHLAGATSLLPSLKLLSSLHAKVPSTIKISMFVWVQWPTYMAGPWPSTGPVTQQATGVKWNYD
jgi:hypothetical protein